MDYELKSDLNKVGKFSHSDLAAMAQDTAKLWDNWTQIIRPLLDESSEAWQSYGSNSPNRAKITETVSVLGSYEANRNKRKGIRFGLVANSVDSVTSLLHNATFNDDVRFFKGRPKNQLGRTFQDLYETYKTQNLAENEFLSANLIHRLNCYIDGTAVAACPFRRKTKDKVVYKPISDLIPPDLAYLFPPVEEIEKDVPYWEGTDFQPLNFSDYRIEPTATTFEEAGFIRRYYMAPWEVKETFGLKELPMSYGDCCNNDNQWLREKLQAFGLNNIRLSIGNQEEECKDKCLLLVHYDTFVYEGKVYKNHVRLILNDCETIFFGENDYNHKRKPYICTPYTPIPGTVYGKSGIKDILPGGHVFDSAVSMALEIFHWAAKPILKQLSTDAALAALGDIEFRPGMRLPMQNMNSIEPLIFPMPNMQALTYIMEMAEKWIRERSGATMPFSGSDPNAAKGNVTAFQVDAHIQGSNTRFQNIMGTYNQHVLVPFMEMAWENDRQFLSETYEIPGFTEELTPNALKMMDMDWTITATMASVMRGREMANYKELLLNVLPTLEKLGVLQRTQEQAEWSPLLLVEKLMQKSNIIEADEIVKRITSGGMVGQAPSMGALPNGSPDQPGTVPTAPPQGGVPPNVGPPQPSGLPIAPGAGAGIPAA